MGRRVARHGRWCWPQTDTLLLLALLLASFGLRVYRLGDKSVWWDEGLAAWAARQSLVDISQWTSADVHPPLYFWMLHYWRLISGDSEFGLRLLSAGVGVLTVVATYWLGRAVADAQTGLLAALLVTLSRFDIWWSQEMRMYALAALLAALTLWAAIRFWDRDPADRGAPSIRGAPRWIDGALYAAFAIAGLYTLYLFVSVIVVANLVWLYVWWRSRERWRALLGWGVAQAAVLLVFAPWLAYALGRIPTWSSASPVAPGVFLRIYWTVLTLGISVNVEHYLWLTLPLLVLFVGGLVAIVLEARGRHRGRHGDAALQSGSRASPCPDARARPWPLRNLALLLLGLLLPALVVYVVSLPRKTFFYSPQLAPRYLLLFAPAFYVLLAWGVLRLGQGRHWAWRTIAILIVVAAALVGLGSYYRGRILEDDYQSLVATLRAYERPGDAVVLYPDRDWPVFSYHYADRWFKVPYAQWMTAESAAAYMAPLWEAHQGIWLVITSQAGVNDPQGEVPAWLEARAAAVVEHRYGSKILRLYARTPERAALAAELAPGIQPREMLDLSLSPGLTLAGWERAVHEVRGGDTVHLFLYWAQPPGHEAPAAVEAATTVEVALVPGDCSIRNTAACAPIGERTAISVTLPGASGGLARQQVDLAISPDTPGGEYAFWVRPVPAPEGLSFGRLTVRQDDRAGLGLDEVSIARRREVDFAEGVRLLGYELDAETLHAGETVYLTLYWQARSPVTERYKVFTHLLGETFNAQNNSFLWGQQDNEPVGGARPTSTWRRGEVIVDSYAIPLSPQAPMGRYEIEIGLYDPVTVERLSVLDAEGQVETDHVVLGHVTVY
jgi:mannosyltransferase